MHTYTQYWQLTRSPFAGQATAEDFYPTAITEEAIARVQFLVDNGRRLGFLLGGPGTGKSLLIDLLSERAAESGMELLRFNLLGLREEEFVCKLAGQLRCLTSEDASYAVQWARIGDRLAANRYQGLSTVVLLDDADQARDDVMPALTRLVLSEQHPAARMTVVLTAQAQRVGSETVDEVQRIHSVADRLRHLATVCGPDETVYHDV